MSILSVRDRVSSILKEDEEPAYTTLYIAGLVNAEWVAELNNRSRLAPFWYTDQKKAMSFSRRQIWLEDPGTASILIVVRTPTANVMPPDPDGKVMLRRPGVVLVQMIVDGKPVHKELQGKQITPMKVVKPPVDIDAL